MIYKNILVSEYDQEIPQSQTADKPMTPQAVISNRLKKVLDNIIIENQKGFLSITNGIVSSKIYDKRDDFNFEIVNFPFLDGDVPRSPSYGVYISQLIRFARVCSNVDDFNNRNLFLTAKLLKQGYRYHKIRKAFSKFYYRHSELIVKYNNGLKTLLQQGISEPIFYGDLVYKFKRIVGKPNFSDQFKKIVKRYIRVGYNLDIMRQSACLV